MSIDSAPTNCPDCAGPVWPERDRLCPRCGYPLMFLQQDRGPEPEVVARAPGERGDATTVPPGPARSTATTGGGPAAGGPTCPRCGQPNPPDRVRCQRCGQELVARQPPARVPPPPPAPAPAPRGGWVGWLIAALVAAVLVAAVAVVVVAVVLDGGEDQAGTGDSGVETPAPTPVPIDRAAISASASSTLADRFAVTNTLDGDHTTCWQSAGARLESNVGVQLTYRFAEPVRLARVTLVNGWARSPTDYQNNQRLARAGVNTDAGSTTWQLRDTTEPQALELEPELTRLVTLVVEEVYPGTRFRDLAITEVAFEALP